MCYFVYSGIDNPNYLQMDGFKWFSLIVLLLVSTSCRGQTANMNTNDIALELAKLERIGKVKVSDRGNDFLLFFEDQMKKDFRRLGYGHRIDEITDTWSVFEDKGYFIVTGSVAKTDNDIYIFCDVYEELGGGRFELLFNQIANDKAHGEYPKNIIPN